MDEYTPTTEQVRGSFHLSDADIAKYPGLAWDQILTVEAFDRWLEGELSKAPAEALREAAISPAIAGTEGGGQFADALMRMSDKEQDR